MRPFFHSIVVRGSAYSPSEFVGWRGKCVILAHRIRKWVEWYEVKWATALLKKNPTLAPSVTQEVTVPPSRLFVRPLQPKPPDTAVASARKTDEILARYALPNQRTARYGRTRDDVMLFEVEPDADES